MTRPSVDQTVRFVLANYLGGNPDLYPDETSFKDLGMDSLDWLEVCLDLEDEYGVVFELRDMRGMETVGELVRRVEGLVMTAYRAA